MEVVVRRALLCVLLLISLPEVAASSPWQICYVDDFESGEPSGDFYCSDYVDEPPADPSQSYLMLTTPSWDGSQGLLLMQGVGGSELGLVIWHVGCHTCTSGVVEVELAAPPDREFGSFELHFEHSGKEEMHISYDKPGAYSHDLPKDAHLGMAIWIGRDVIIDDLHLHSWCDCHTPNESVTWSSLKASYR